MISSQSRYDHFDTSPYRWLLFKMGAYAAFVLQVESNSKQHSKSLKFIIAHPHKKRKDFFKKAKADMVLAYMSVTEDCLRANSGFLQILGWKSNSIGNSSNRPASISNISTYLEK